MTDAPPFCSNCMAELSNDTARKCSACKSAVYCNKDCQRAHWRSGHKHMCAELANMRENVVGDRQSRLFEQWLGAKKSNSEMRWIVGKALTREQVLQQHYVIMNVVFDYNWQTFVPLSLPPAVVHKEKCIFGGIPELPPSKPGKYQHMALIFYKGVTCTRIVTFSQKEIDWQDQNNTWFEMRDELRVQADYFLESSVFSTFPKIRWQNIDKQLNFILSSEPFMSFLPCALKIQTKNPLHLTHVVVIQFQFGYQLGQIKRVVSYKIMEVKDLLDDMETSGNFKPNVMAQNREGVLNLALHQDPPRRLVMVPSSGTPTLQ